MGFEPTTSSMPSRRAPNCATAPPKESLSLSQPVKESLASSLQVFPDFIISLVDAGYAAACLRRRMILPIPPQRLVKRTLVLLVAALALAYAGDLWFRLRLI